MKKLFPVVVIAQTGLHYLGLLGFVLGVIALIFGNVDRGVELSVGGVGFIVLKYLIGFLYLSISKTSSDKDSDNS